MADVVVERLIARLEGEERGYVQMLSDADQELDSLERSTDNAEAEQEELNEKFAEGGTQAANYTKEIVAAGAALVTTAIGVKKLTDAFIEQEQAEVGLRAILQANGREVQSRFNDYTQFATAIQQTTRVGDESALSMLQQAEALGLTGDQAKRAIKNSIGLAAAMGMNERSALRYAAVLEEGDTTMLQRYLPALRSIEDQNEKVAVAQEQLNKMFEIETALADTLGGQLDQTSNAFGDLMEQIGGIIAEALQPLAGQIKNVITWIQSWNEGLLKTITWVGIIAGAVVPFVALVKVLTVAVWKQVIAMGAWIVKRIAQLALMGPKGWAILAAATIAGTAAIVGSIKAMEKANKKMREHQKESREAAKKLLEVEDAQTKLAESTDETTKALKKQNEEIDHLRKHRLKLFDEGVEFAKKFATPFEKAAREAEELREQAERLLTAGTITEEIYTRALQKAAKLRTQAIREMKEATLETTSAPERGSQEDIEARFKFEKRAEVEKELRELEKIKVGGDRREKVLTRIEKNGRRGPSSTREEILRAVN